MGKIKAKQIALSAAFTNGSGDALDLADEGVSNAKLAGGITAGKLSQSLLNQIVTGQRQRESVLVLEQLISGGISSGIAPATVIYVDTAPSANDTLIIKNADQTETYTFKASEAAAFDVEIGTAAETAAFLAQAINDDSAGWSAVVKATLGDIGNPVVVIYRKTASAAADDRVYKTTGGGLRHIAFADGRYDATVSSSGVMTAIDADNLTTLGASDPGTPTFGFGRAMASLIDGELRFAMAGGASYVYDADANQWDNAGAAVIGAGAVGVDEISTAIAGPGLAGGGGAALSVNVDDTGIEINADTLRLKDGGVVAAKLGATSVTAAKLGSDVAGNGLTGGNASALAVLAANTSVNVAVGGVKAAVPVKDDKALAPTGAITTDDADTGLTITKTPAAGSYVKVSLNGVGIEVGDGVKTKDGYFTGDSGTTARAISAVVATDKFFWNAVISGVNLSTSDEFDFDYLNTTP